MKYLTRIAFTCVIGGALTLSGFAQDAGDWEWNAEQGYNREEWYDPTDWFDDEEPVSYQYDSPFSWNESYAEGPWYSDYRDMGGVPTTVFIWVPSTQEWTRSDQAQATQAQQKTFQGTVDGFREVGDRASGTRTLMRVTLENGQSQVVDLGKRTEMEDLDLQRGDEIKVTGRQGQVEGQQAIIAQNLEIDGRTHQLQRQDQWRNSLSSEQGNTQSQQTRQTGTSSEQGNTQSQQTRQASTSAGQGNSQSQQAQQTGQQGEWKTIQGTIQSFRQVQMRGTGKEAKDHTLAAIQTNDGQRREIYLGPKQDFDRMQLNEGDQIQATGEQGKIGENTVFLPRTVQSGGQQFAVTYAGKQQQPQASGRQQDRQMMTFEGTIDGFRQIQSQGQGQGMEDRTLVKVTLQDGQSKVVDLGRRTELEDLNLERGDRIKVTGYSSQVEGQQALVAQNLELDGQRYALGQQGGRETTIGLRPGEQGSGQTLTYSGKVKQLRQAQVGTERQNHLIGRLEMRQGQEIVVDFGPNTTKEDLGIEQGDQVRVTGQRTQVDDKSILVAREFSVEGQEGTRTTNASKERSSER